LRGLELEAPESALPAAADGAYYHFQIIGCRVRDIEGHEIGTVSGIMETGANDVYVIARPGGGEALVPAVSAVIRAIDTAERIITIDPPHGLIE
jgi:16S rRNA processing protein RimM